MNILILENTNSTSFYSPKINGAIGFHFRQNGPRFAFTTKQKPTEGTCVQKKYYVGMNVRKKSKEYSINRFYS
ncbi:hypothetical protein LEP1GSC060_0116 [Leptospira weilii serovar Ranarum str. ICFT]|uniref:Uncharacterized protein n=1 Tax=Leptospira weilii serovar Ranarum str. ICFT TaxID=1218598 RepID=N1WAH4_9LEPT|nr:hypothetical protein LEP1GSC060_0116 [Leptospira weilii serovar Ranarum str. ICFT]